MDDAPQAPIPPPTLTSLGAGMEAEDAVNGLLAQIRSSPSLRPTRTAPPRTQPVPKKEETLEEVLLRAMVTIRVDVGDNHDKDDDEEDWE